MKFRCERDLLQTALTNASYALPSSSGYAHPVQNGLLFSLTGDQLTVTGNNLDMSIRSTVVVGDADDGEMVLNGRLVTEIVKSMPSGAVTFTPDPDNPNRMMICGGAARFGMATVNATEFVRLADPTGEPIELDVTEFLAGLGQVLPAASSDPSRPVLCGVLVETNENGLRLVATDSYRLGLRELPSVTLPTVDTQVLLPREAVKELLRGGQDADKMTVRLDTQSASFQYGSTTLVTRLIEGTFPAYQGVIPTEFSVSFELDRIEFIEVVKRVQIVNGKNSSASVNFTVGTDHIEVSAVNTEGFDASENVQIVLTGEPGFSIAFAPEYLLPGLQASESDRVQMSAVNTTKPAVIRGVDDDQFRYLVMPHRRS